MPQMGTPEEYFGTTEQTYVVAQPVDTKVVAPVTVSEVVQPVRFQPQAQLQTADYTPLIIGVCFLGTICFLAFLAWTWKK